MRALIASLTVVLLSPVAVAAQETAPRPPVHYEPGAPNVVLDRALQQSLVERGNSDRLRYIRDEPVERWRRAERLSAMANSGQCVAAVQIARREGDNAMARRLSAACDDAKETPAERAGLGAR